MNESSIAIRHARVEDLPSIYAIEKECFKDPYPFELFKIFLNLPGVFLVAEYEGSIIGYVVVLIRDGMGHIFSIAVAEKFRRRGVGKMLLKRALAILREIEIKTFRLEVRVSNYPAQQLYKLLGFKVDRRIPSYYPDGEDAYVMTLTLP